MRGGGFCNEKCRNLHTFVVFSGETHIFHGLPSVVP